MGMASGIWVLLGIWLLGAVALAAVPPARARTWSLAVSGAALLVVLLLAAAPPVRGSLPWIPAWGAALSVSTGGATLPLLLLTGLLLPLVIIFSPSGAGRLYYFWILVAGFAAAGLFTTRDLLLFYGFFEAVLLPGYFLLAGWGGPGAPAAARRFLVMNLTGSFLMLVGVVELGLAQAAVLGHPAFGFRALEHTRLGGAAGAWTLAAFTLAFAVKAPLWPLHGWMPDAYREAPPPVTALFAGLLSKAGLYGFLVVVLPFLGRALAPVAPWFLAGAAVSLVWGALTALRRTDAKLVATYASLSHMGMMALGLFSLTPAGMAGATLLMLAHGLAVGGVFLILGVLEQATGGERTLGRVGGLAVRAPAFGFWFLFFALAVLGLPGLAGFAGEYLVVQGLVERAWPAAVVAVAVMVLAAWYMLRLFQGLMQGPREQPPGVPAGLGAGRGRLWALAAGGAVLLLLGVWPAGVTARAGPALVRAVRYQLPGTVALARVPAAPAAEGGVRR